MSDRGDKSKKKKRPPALVSNVPQPHIGSVKPVEMHSNAVANLTDHTEVEVNGKKITVAIKDMEIMNKLGEGQYGVVEKMKLKNSDLIFAVKKIRCSMNDKEQRRLLNDLNISMRSSQCPYVVVSYGAMFQGGDVWICMEMLDTSLDKFYQKVPSDAFIPEKLLAYATFCVVTALEYLHRELKVIHRDVKPSNVLLDKCGRVKVCDFGISGDLINSMAKTNVGSQPYLAPERINPDRSGTGYSIRSDVWSLGLSVLELAIRKFPYSRWSSLFDQLKDVVGNETPPSLPNDSKYSETVRNFISRCLVKKDEYRASYEELLKHDLLIPFQSSEYLQTITGNFAEYVVLILGP